MLATNPGDATDTVENWLHIRNCRTFDCIPAEPARTSLSSTVGTTVIPSRLQRANHHRQTVPNGLIILLLVLVASSNFIHFLPGTYIIPRLSLRRVFRSFAVLFIVKFDVP